jgi:hypothetical protein
VQAFPSGADYMEALQHPSSCFANDPELAGGAPVLSPLGLPRAVSGNFASVFRIDCDNGRSYAVRCFTRWFDDQHERYQAISEHLATLDDPWLVGFDYVPEGVNVNGEWYPILKMPWLGAQPLLPYIETNLWDTAAMAYLAVRFAELVQHLRARGIAHGDLQHGNLLVAPGGDLRLIDFDGMYVPALAGRGSNELGHRNYQHPGRRRDEFGPCLDHFASWVVYASLTALSIDPVLWGRLDGGDECLLFRSRDLREPESSEALEAFDASGDDRLRFLASMLRRALAGPSGAVPPLDLRRVPAPATALFEQATAGSLAELAERQSLFAVLRGDVTAPESAPGAPDTVSGDDIGLDAPKPVLPKGFGPAIASHRRLLIAAGLADAAFIVLSIVGALPLGLGIVLALVAATASGYLAHHQFHALPEVKAIRPKQLELAELTKAAATAKAAVADLTQRRLDADRLETDAAKQAADLEASQRREEHAAIAKLDAEVRAALADITQREHELYRAEQHERADALRALQQSALDEQLRKYPLASARIPHVADQLVYALALDDVRTAADFVDVVVDESRTRSKVDETLLVLADGRHIRLASLGPEQARQLIAWRRTLESKYSYAKPESLPKDRDDSIRAAYVSKRQSLEDEQRQVRATARRKADEIRATLRARQDQVALQVQAAQHGAAGTRLKLDQELVRARKVAAVAEWRRATCERELDSYAALTFPNFLRAVAGLGQ